MRVVLSSESVSTGSVNHRVQKVSTSTMAGRIAIFVSGWLVRLVTTNWASLTRLLHQCERPETGSPSVLRVRIGSEKLATSIRRRNSRSSLFYPWEKEAFWAEKSYHEVLNQQGNAIDHIGHSKLAGPITFLLQAPLVDCRSFSVNSRCPRDSAPELGLLFCSPSCGIAISILCCNPLSLLGSVCVATPVVGKSLHPAYMTTILCFFSGTKTRFYPAAASVATPAFATRPVTPKLAALEVPQANQSVAYSIVDEQTSADQLVKCTRELTIYPMTGPFGST